MLKIRDGIDLKELEKFGFINQKWFGYQLQEKVNENWNKVIAEVGEDRILWIAFEKEDYVKDLLKNIIEKVD